MNIEFNENGDFYFLRKDDVRRDFGCYAYRLASPDLGSEMIVLSKQNLTFKPLEKVSLFDLEVEMGSCTFVFRGSLQSLN
ncbi:hypothetical protein D3233_10055 [Staphylococcus aureus]|uniref:Uncharacterized protein n=1 Tax=Staphylococcus agnetis TaxID=985762 RepID=A0ABX3Z4Z4_9STAP|nr:MULTISPECIES: hypothetical protein [Staphylococcus]EZT66059.1 hypothetical protein U885_01883 [Staphylococcus aureus 81629]EZU79208.1 hypothetical protein U995_02585 [Staphylococcus aureus 1111203374]EZU94800.1 hypothetical protein U920_02530 [Staphylococcus aureus 11S00627]EZV18997.1 hypothetical protein U926_01567 [Staphylococcus aureus 12S00881]EZV22811.1 hypothetical protein U928_01978 [Staphylococcus aureus 12S01153]